VVYTLKLQPEEQFSGVSSWTAGCVSVFLKDLSSARDMQHGARLYAVPVIRVRPRARLGSAPQRGSPSAPVPRDVATWAKGGGGGGFVDWYVCRSYTP
jgi:hypothetical protein